MGAKIIKKITLSERNFINNILTMGIALSENKKLPLFCLKQWQNFYFFNAQIA
jgi:hypothetical protein